jgi:hypothetical protein
MGPLIFVQVVVTCHAVQQTRAPRKPGSKSRASGAVETGHDYFLRLFRTAGCVSKNRCSKSFRTVNRCRRFDMLIRNDVPEPFVPIPDQSAIYHFKPGTSFFPPTTPFYNGSLRSSTSSCISRKEALEIVEIWRHQQQQMSDLEELKNFRKTANAWHGD